MKKKYVFDIDGTLVTQNPNDQSNYPAAKPITEAVRRVNQLFDDGHEIVLMTARGQ